MEKEKLFTLFSDAVGVSKDKLSFETSTENLPEWDSLGFLTFLSALDDETNGSSAEITDLTEASSLQEVYDILKKNNVW